MKRKNDVVIIGDARDLPVESDSIQTIVTSPPYWGQRDYGFAEQIGVEATYLEYIKNLQVVANEMHRVLRNDGTLWLNLGDTYNTRAPIRPSTHQGGLGFDNENIRKSWAEHAAEGKVRYSARQPALKDKDLMGLPWRVATLLTEMGWFLRCDVIWSKPFCSPEKAYDRPRRMHEYVFLFAKSKRYKYHRQASDSAVWEIAPSSDPTHTAIFPDELVRRCLVRTTDEGDTVLDPFAGSGTVGRVARKMKRKVILLDGKNYD